MAYRTDGGGLAFKCNDIKIQTGGSTWAMRLSQLPRQSGYVFIITYSLPDMSYVRVQLGRRPSKISIIAHSKFIARARDIRREFPRIRVAVSDRIHSKVVLIEPQTVMVSSANFGSSKWHETTMSVHSKEAYEWYFENAWKSLWMRSKEI